MTRDNNFMTGNLGYEGLSGVGLSGVGLSYLESLS